MRIVSLLMVVGVGCGVSNGAVDGGAKNDAARGSGSGSGTMSNLDIKTSTLTEVGSDGSKFVSVEHFAVVDGISGGDDFKIELCDSTTTYYGNSAPGAACPVNYTCTTTGDPIPTGQTCSWQNGGGAFVGGELMIYAGAGFIEYNSAGSATSGTDTTYGTIEIFR